MATIETLLATAPASTSGVELGWGDWRISVEMLLPSDGQALWGVARWGDTARDVWATLEWVDVSEYVRGVEWELGATDFDGRPEVTAMAVTLANNAYEWSAFNPDSAFRDLTFVDADTDGIRNYYFAPGTIVRLVAHSPLGFDGEANVLTGEDKWVPLFTGRVDRWPEVRQDLGDVESRIELTVVQTLAELARVDDNERPLEGDDDTLDIRIRRLADDAGWPFGYRFTPSAGDATDALFQSTVMSANRLTELYLSGDSVGCVVRTDRSGAIVVHYHGDAPFRGPFASRNFRLFATVNPASSLDPDEPAHVHIVPDGIRLENDASAIVNDVAFARVGGTVQTATSPLSIGRYRRSTARRSDLLVKSNTVVQGLAAVVVQRRAFADRRIESAVLHSLADPNAIGAMLTLDTHVPIWVYTDAVGGVISWQSRIVDGISGRLIVHGPTVPPTLEMVLRLGTSSIAPVFIPTP